MLFIILDYWWLLALAAVPIVGMLFCCCQAVCAIFEDKFTRSNSTDMGSDWTEVVGDWSITGNHARVSTANAVLACNTPNPNGTAAMHMHAITTAPFATGEAYRLMLDYVDEDNYLYAETIHDPSSSGVGRWSIGRRTAGVDTELDGYPLVGGSIGGQMDFCISPDLSSCTFFINNIAPDRLTVGGLTTSSDKFAIGTGTVNGPADFDEVAVTATFTGDGCTECEPVLCQRDGDPLCDPATGRPEQVQLEISGVANNSGTTCESGCDGDPPNGTFVLDLDPDRTAGSPCSYYVAVSAFCTGRDYDNILVQIGASGAGGQRKIRAHFCQNLSCTSGGTSFEYTFSGTDLEDCSALDVNLTGVAGGSCDLSGATCRLTAV